MNIQMGRVVCNAIGEVIRIGMSVEETLQKDELDYKY